MKRLTLLACAFALLACSSTQSPTNATTTTELFQLIGPADLNYPGGSIEVKFGLRVQNGSPGPIKLRQIQMAPVGLGGPYRLRSRTYFFNDEIGPNDRKDIAFWVRADAEGDANAVDASAPISVRAIAIFESPHGGFRKIMMKTFPQQGTGPTAGQ